MKFVFTMKVIKLLYACEVVVVVVVFMSKLVVCRMYIEVSLDGVLGVIFFFCMRACCMYLR